VGVDHVIHLLQDVEPALAGLLQGGEHDFATDAADLYVHLDGGHAVLRPRHLEVHVAKMVLVPEDVRQNRDIVALLDEPHRDAGDGSGGRDPGVHHREGRPAHRGHGGGPFDSRTSETTRTV